MLTITLAVIFPISALMLVALSWHTSRGQRWLATESERHMIERLQQQGMIADVKELKLPAKPVAETKKAA